MAGTTTPEWTSTRRATTGTGRSDNSADSKSTAPEVAPSARSFDMASDVHATISTTAMTEPPRGLRMEDVFHGQCDPGSWVDVTSELTYQGPEALDAGGVFTVSLAGDGRNEYQAELVSISGSAAHKLAAPDERSSKRRWSLSWTVTEKLEPGEGLSVAWRMTGSEATDPSRGTHVDATFLYPAGDYTGLAETEEPWIGAPADSTGTPGADYAAPTRFFGFVSAS